VSGQSFFFLLSVGYSGITLWFEHTTIIIYNARVTYRGTVVGCSVALVLDLKILYEIDNRSAMTMPNTFYTIERRLCKKEILSPLITYNMYNLLNYKQFLDSVNDIFSQTSQANRTKLRTISTYVLCIIFVLMLLYQTMRHPAKRCPLLSIQ